MKNMRSDSKEYQLRAGEENRTLVTTLEKLRSAIELHPRNYYYTKRFEFAQGK